MGKAAGKTERHYSQMGHGHTHSRTSKNQWKHEEGLEGNITDFLTHRCTPVLSNTSAKVLGTQAIQSAMGR
jgi:hypothetical protein